MKKFVPNNKSCNIIQEERIYGFRIRKPEIISLDKDDDIFLYFQEVLENKRDPHFFHHFYGWCSMNKRENGQKFSASCIYLDNLTEDSLSILVKEK